MRKKSLKTYLMLLDRIPVRIRLSLGHALWMGIIFAGIGFGVYRVVEDSITSSLDTTLMTSAQTIRETRFARNSYYDKSGSPLLKAILDEFFGDRIAIRSHAQMVDVSGQIKAQSGNTRVNTLPVTPQAVNRASRGLETFETFHLPNYPPLRQITLPVMRDNRFTGELIQVGAPMDNALATLASVRKMLWISLVSGLIMSVVFGYLLVKRSFRPVARITRAASGLSANELQLRLRLPPANDELRVLTRTFNEMLDRLEDAFGRLRKFAGDVSHELRTPLAVLRGEVELALRRERTEDEYKEALKVIARESTSMSTIVEDLLLLARAQGNAIAIKREDVKASDFLEEVKRMVAKAFAAKSVELEVNNYVDGCLRICPSYFSLVLSNLLLNACKHSAAGSKVELIVTCNQDYSEYVIRDYGEGIPKDSIPYIFDAFYRADTARNRNSGGTGIGLSLAQALVILHKGHIRVESEVNKGTTFIVTIPNDKANLIQQPRQKPVKFIAAENLKFPNPVKGVGETV